MSRLARILLVIALLAGWQAALEHPIEHVDERGQLVHLHHSDENDPEAGPLCDLLASLTACAPGGSIIVTSSAGAYQPPALARSAVRPAEAPPFLSHAPPAS